jgi:hypothetical protein
VTEDKDDYKHNLNRRIHCDINDGHKPGIDEYDKVIKQANTLYTRRGDVLRKLSSDHTSHVHTT